MKRLCLPHFGGIAHCGAVHIAVVGTFFFHFLTCTYRTQIQNPKFKTPDSEIQTPKLQNQKIPNPNPNLTSRLQNQNSSKTPKSKIQNPNPQIQNPRWEDLKGLKFKANRPAFASRHRSRISSHFSSQKWDKEQHQHDDV